MLITAELSLYPLKEEFESSIIKFIKTLKSNNALEVYTHSMSTYVKGENKELFLALSDALELINKDADTVSLVIKVVNRDLAIEKGFLNFD